MKTFARLLIWSALVAMTVFAYAFGWAWLVTFSPAEVTELQRVPHILQGGNDWGGSNIFAAYVSGLFLYGLLGCLIQTAILIDYRSPAPQRRRFITLEALGGMLTIFLSLQLFSGIGGTVSPDRHKAYDCVSLYYSYDFSTVGLLFTLTYFLSAIWIFAISKLALPPIFKFILAPSVLVLILYLGYDGFTPKAGQIVQSGEIPARIPLSWRHNLMLNAHDFVSSILATSECTEIVNSKRLH